VEEPETQAVAATMAAVQAVGGRLRPRCRRGTAHGHACAYVRGLLSDAKRKNGWQLAEQAGYRQPRAIQRVLDRSGWDADAVRDDLRAFVVEALGDPAGVLVVDATGFLKQGAKSVGVQRQYSGTAGRIEHCQMGVWLGYASTTARVVRESTGRAPCPGSGLPTRRDVPLQAFLWTSASRPSPGWR